MAQPNILFIQSDQHRYDCVGVNDPTRVKTPNLDRLAAEGMNFDACYCPIPVCVPARNSLMTGQWPTSHLAIANWNTEAPRPAREDLPTFSHALREDGYWLGHVGKWHVHPEQGPQAYGFHETVDRKDYFRWRAEQGIPAQPQDRGPFGEIDPFVTSEQTRLAWSARHVVAMLERAAQGDAPFFIRWDPVEPHFPNRVPEPYYSQMYPPETIPPWPSFPDSFENKPFIQAQQLRTWRVDDWTWSQWAPVVSRYLGEITLLDEQIGRVLHALDRLGLVENTLVIYTSDHGDMCGGHGMIDKHFVMYDDVVRVPLLAWWPGRITPGSTCEAFVSNSIDLPATFCAVAGVPVPETFQGENLLPLFDGAQENGRTDILCMYMGNQFGLFSQRMVRDRRWKYVWNAVAEDELYDLATDPGELRNLAFDPAHRAELNRLRHRLVAWMEAIDDSLLNHWTRSQLLEGLK